MKLIIGLGNPGEQYESTRHNLGFVVVDELKRKLDKGTWEQNKKFKAELHKVSEDLLLVRPQTYMNLSGLSVASLKNFYKIDPKDIIVIHDELDLLLGKIKVRLGGGAGGHHGVESIIEKLGTDQFIRLRLGIGTKEGFLGEHKRTSFNAEHFVIDAFHPTERSKVKSMIKHALKALETLLEEGLEKAQNQFN